MLIGGAQDNGLITYDNGSWYIKVGFDGYDCLINNADVNNSYGQANFPIIIQSTNRGHSFGTSIQPTMYCNPTIPTAQCPFPSWWAVIKWPIQQDVATNEVITGHHDMFRRVAGNWIAFSDFTTDHGVPENQQIRAFAQSESNPDVMYVGFGYPTWMPNPTGKMFVTHDGGTSWTDITPSAVQYATIESIAIDPENPARLWVAFGDIWESPANSGVGVNRVWYSGDYGATWTDYSENLPVFPVNVIVYQKGSQDGLYVGTDVGVFYRDANNYSSQWECFGNGMPNVRITDLEINYCANKIRAATFGRGLWESPLSDAYPIALTINQPLTISSDREFVQDVIIASGTTVTVTNGATVNMAKGRTIFVTRNAKLIVEDGSTITNLCGEMWKGIQVWGIENTPQLLQPNDPNNPHGYLKITDSEISNAQNGVSLIKKDLNGNLFWAYTGGIVQARNTKFLNNIRDIEFMSYPYSNQSYFRNCEFITDGLLNNANASPTAHVTSYQTYGVKYQGCRFENKTPGLYGYTQRGKGIRTIGGSYLVTSFCTAPIPIGGQCQIKSHFEGLYFGIDAASGNQMNSLAIKQCEFVNNWTGVHISGIDFPIITQNSFDIGPAEQQSSAIGLYLNNSAGYEVEGNTFTSTYSTDPIGMIVYNTCSNPNADCGYQQVYRNFFSGIGNGVRAQGNNDGIALFDGLEIKCNRFTNMNFAFADIGITSGAVSIWQGFCVPGWPANIRPANNEFSHTAIKDIWANSPVSPFVYTYSSGSALVAPSAGGWNPVNTIMWLCTGPSYNPAVDCPPHALKGFKRSQLLQNMSNLKQAGETLLLQLDGGDTPGLLSKVYDLTYAAKDLKDDLVASYPLSSAVLIALIERPYATDEDELEDQLDMLGDILADNKPLATQVIGSLLERDYPIAEDAEEDYVELLGDILEDNFPLNGYELTEYINKVNPAHDENVEDYEDELTDLLEDHSPLKQEILNAVLMRSPALPEDDLEDLMEKQDGAPFDEGSRGLSAGYEIELNAAASFKERDLNLNELIRQYLHDTLVVDGIDSAVAVLKNEGRMLDKCRLTGALVCCKKYSEAQALVDSIRIVKPAMEDFCRMQEILMQIDQAVDKCLVLKSDSLLKQDVETIASSGTGRQECANAQALLKFAFATSFPQTVEPLVFGNNQKTGWPGENEVQESDKTTKTLEAAMATLIYPNPFKDEFTVKTTLKKGADARVLIYTLMNKIVLDKALENNSEVVNTGHLASGSYIVAIELDGVTVKRKQMMLVR